MRLRERLRRRSSFLMEQLPCLRLPADWQIHSKTLLQRAGNLGSHLGHGRRILSRCKCTITSHNAKKVSLASYADCCSKCALAPGDIASGGAIRTGQGT